MRLMRITNKLQHPVAFT